MKTPHKQPGRKAHQGLRLTHQLQVPDPRRDWVARLSLVCLLWLLTGFCVVSESLWVCASTGVTPIWSQPWWAVTTKPYPKAIKFINHGHRNGNYIEKTGGQVKFYSYSYHKKPHSGNSFYKILKVHNSHFHINRKCLLSPY